MSNIFRVVKDKNYTIVSNEYIKDKNLKLESIGLMTLILSLPSEFKINMNSLISITNDKVNYRYIKQILNNLKENGYLVINKHRDEKGLFYFDYIFFESNRLNPLYTFYIVDNNNPSVINIDNNTSQPPTNQPLVVKCIDNINTIDNKINIDKNKLNLCFLTEYLIEWNFIQENDINLFGYDNFLTSFLDDNPNEYKLVIEVVNYVVKTIMKNKFLDENGNEINNLLSYFIESCKSNMRMLINNRDLVLYPEFDD